MFEPTGVSEPDSIEVMSRANVHEKFVVDLPVSDQPMPLLEMKNEAEPEREV